MSSTRHDERGIAGRHPSVPASIALFVLAAFSAELASVTARNADLLQHLANGRDFLAGSILPATGWWFDLFAHALYGIGGGFALMAAKAAAVGVAIAIVFRLGQVGGNWTIPAIATGCAALALNHRLPLQPVVVSVLLLAVLLRLLDREMVSRTSARPGWRLAALFVAWANLHDWWIFGLAIVAMTWLGQSMDRDHPAKLRYRGLSLLILIAACGLSPLPFNGFQLPSVLQWSGASGDIGLQTYLQTLHSPFSLPYRTLFGETPAALAYYPLLALGLLSFPLNRSGWRWSRFLPFLAVSALSAFEARTIPVFAIVAAPILSRNLGELFANRSRSYGWPASIAGLAFLIAAWPGWLQTTPYEPRRWAVEPPPDLAAGAAFVQSAHACALWKPETRTLHLTRDSLAAFAWYCPKDVGMVSDRAIDELIRPRDGAFDGRLLDDLRINRVIVRAGDPSSELHLARFLADPANWSLLSVEGGVAVFGRRAELQHDAQVDLDRIAYRPTEAERAPLEQPFLPKWDPSWNRYLPLELWGNAFFHPAPSRSAARDEARLHMLVVDTLGSAAPYRNMLAWESAQIAGMAATANPLAGVPAVEAALRLNLFQPPLPDADPFAKPTATALSRMVFAFQQRFALDRGQASPGRIHSAIRAGRRATAETPSDAMAHFLLGKAYLALPQQTAEQKWGTRFTQIARLRNVQASAALNRAVSLYPSFADAHFELGFLYQGAGCLDLALVHLREWKKLETARLRTGGDRTRLERMEPILERLDKEVRRHMTEFEKEATRIAVAERAALAVRRGLGGAARDLLLKSDVSAFGKQGTEIELDFLLRTGRPQDVLDWLTPEVQGSVGNFAYRWMRTQAHAAEGNYAAARDELGALMGPNGTVPEPTSVRNRICELIGAAILDEQPNRTQLPSTLLYGLRHSDFLGHMLELESTVAGQCEAAVLDGLLAMECGRMAEARGRFQSVLAHAPRRGSVAQLNIPAIEVARDAMQLLDEFGDK